MVGLFLLQEAFQSLGSLLIEDLVAKAPKIGALLQLEGCLLELLEDLISVMFSAHFLISFRGCLLQLTLSVGFHCSAGSWRSSGSAILLCKRIVKASTAGLLEAAKSLDQDEDSEHLNLPIFGMLALEVLDHLLFRLSNALDLYPGLINRNLQPLYMHGLPRQIAAH